MQKVQQHMFWKIIKWLTTYIQLNFSNAYISEYKHCWNMAKCHDFKKKLEVQNPDSRIKQKWPRTDISSGTRCFALQFIRNGSSIPDCNLICYLWNIELHGDGHWPPYDYETSSYAECQNISLIACSYISRIYFVLVNKTNMFRCWKCIFLRLSASTLEGNDLAQARHI